MQKNHLLNIFFESELKTGAEHTLAEWIRSHPIYLQLQFLPLLYADPGDIITVSDLPHPSEANGNFCTLDSSTKKFSLSTWGASRAIEKWADASLFPSWETVRQVQSKAFAFQESPILEGSALIETEAELKQWLKNTRGRKVIKQFFGTAGRDQTRIDSDTFPELEFPVIAQPWKNKVFEFSTQWIVTDHIQHLGSTAFQTNEQGAYLSTIVGSEKQIFGPYFWALESHLEAARKILLKMKQIGFFGNVGIDAFIYNHRGKVALHPIGEINARKTMGWVALQIQRARYPMQPVCCSYLSNPANGVLPSKLRVKGKTMNFTKNFCVEPLPFGFVTT